MCSACRCGPCSREKSGRERETRSLRRKAGIDQNIEGTHGRFWPCGTDGKFPNRSSGVARSASEAQSSRSFQKSSLTRQIVSPNEKARRLSLVHSSSNGCWGLLGTGNSPRPIQCREALDPVVGTASTPKSQTYMFMPSGRISASAYSPGGRGALSVNR